MDRSPAVIRAMAEARTALELAEENYVEARKRAVGEWKCEVDAGHTDKPFWEWTRCNAPYLRQAVELQKQTQATFDAVSELYYGRDAGVLASIRTGIRTAMETNTNFLG
jgi:hypothetical protein